MSGQVRRVGKQAPLFRVRFRFAHFIDELLSFFHIIGELLSGELSSYPRVECSAIIFTWFNLTLSDQPFSDDVLHSSAKPAPLCD